MTTLQQSLPAGVTVVETYDRSAVVSDAINSLTHKLVLEILLVALVCYLFLGQFTSSLAVILVLPLGILSAIAFMRWQGITINIMSLGGIAITIGAMVDAAIVAVENVHRKLEEANQNAAETGKPVTGVKRIILEANFEVAPALFVSLLIITLSFVPLLALEAQAGKLFDPLVYTKTYAMAASVVLSITLVPVLTSALIKIKPDKTRPKPVLLHWLERRYEEILKKAFKYSYYVGALAFALVVVSAYPLSKSGTEFMPRFDEGDLLFMPTTLPGVSISKARELLVLTDQLIASVPEVKTTFGKVGRADTATDPAPLNMIETTILLKPKSEWRQGMTLDKLIAELDSKVRVPGLVNAWVQPIRTRIDMLSTGTRTPLGLNITGVDSATVQEIGKRVEAVLSSVEETSMVLADRNYSGRYLKIEPDRNQLARFGLSVADVNDAVRYAIGGASIGVSIEGSERYPINVRYPQSSRDSLPRLRNIPLIAANGSQVLLGDVCRLYFDNEDAVVKTENSRLSSRVLINIRDVPVGDYIEKVTPLLQDLDLPGGYTWSWTGEYQYMKQAHEQLLLIVPVVLLVMLILVSLIFSNWLVALIPLVCLPLALVGGIWLTWSLGIHLSIATLVGFIAMAGVAVEFSIVMLLYLENEFRSHVRNLEIKDIDSMVIAGAVKRIRPKVMTVTVLIVGLGSVALSEGMGSEIMYQIAAPIIGGMVSAPLLSLIIIPIVFRAVKLFELNQRERASGNNQDVSEAEVYGKE